LGARYLLHNTSFLYCYWLLGPTLMSTGYSFFVFGMLTYMLHIGISSRCIYLCDFGLVLIVLGANLGLHDVGTNACCKMHLF
jgi:hypothetical protein